MRHKFLANVFISAVLVATVCGCGQSTQSSAPQQEKKHTFPADVVGSMKGIRVRVPGQYVFFPPQYEGEDPWTRRKTTPVRTQDSPLVEVSILVLPPEMRPRRLDEVSQIAKALSGRPSDNPWISVGITSRSFDVPGNVWMRGLIERTKVSNPWNWHYQDTGTYQNGLRKFTLVEADYSKIDIRNDAFLFDDKEWSTVIKCGEGAVAPGGGNQCRQTFAVPEVNALVAFSYHSTDFPKWKEMQARLREVVVSFSVERSSK